MSKFVNRLKLIDNFLTQDYYGYKEHIKGYFYIDSIDNVLEKITSNTDELLYDKNICYFLCKQNAELVDFIKDDVIANKEIYTMYLKNKGFKNNICFETLNEINIFKKAMTTNNFLSSDRFVYSLRSGASFERVIYAIEFFERNNVGIQNSKCNVFVHKDDLIGLIKNDFIWNLSDKDIVKVILNVNQIGLTYDNLTEYILEIVKNHNSIYVYNLNKENIDLIDKIVSVISDELEVEDENKDFYGYGNIRRKFKCKLYEFREELNTLIGIIFDKYSEKDTQKQLMISVLKAIEFEFICTIDDMKLLVNKFKYDFKPENALSIGIDFAGINMDLVNRLGLSNNNVARIVQFRKGLPKGFFRKIINSNSLAEIIFRPDTDILKSLSIILELSQLNESQIKNIYNIIISESFFVLRFIGDFDSVEYKLSFDEFKCIYHNREFITPTVINGLKNMKQSARLLKMKAVIEINKTLKNKSFCISRGIIDEYIVDKDMIALMRKNNPLRISDIGDYIEYKVIDSIVSIDSISHLNKIKFLIKNGYRIDDLKGLSIEDIDSKVWSSNQLLDLTSKMNLSDSFKEEYKDDIIDFLSSEEYKLVNSYYKNPYSANKQKNGIMLIGKSLIANKYEELKFVRGDIKKEVSIDISDEAFEAWKRTDILTKGDYTVQDSSDFKYIMKMGEVPVRSCMNYVNGMYSHCLLSNFDTSKKMIVIHKNGKYVGRAILRLTVMSDTNETVLSSLLEFVDVDTNSDDANKLDDANNNQTIIFLEKAYTTLDSRDFKECYNMIIELLKEKANEMGAKLVTSYNYGEYVGDDCSEEYKYVFITASKNGAQYLDSFDGSTSSSYCYKRGRVYIY